MIDVNNPELEDQEPEFESPLDELMEGETEDLIEQDDGSVEIPLDSMGQEPQAFDSNLADFLSESELTAIADELLELVEHDQQSRKKRDEQYEDGIRRTGLGDDAPGGAQFSGASKVVHPVLAESCIDFAARAVKELLPAKGPVKINSDGDLPLPEEMQAKALAKCLNDQFTRKIKEYRSVYEQKLTQLPLGGSQYTKFYVDRTKNRICAEFVPIDDLFIPFYATSFYDAERITHRQFLTRYEYESRVDSQQYRDVKLLDAIDPERSSSAVATDKIEGKELDGYNDDGVRSVYEIYTWQELDDDEFSQGSRAPYIISIDVHEQKVLSIYRNWEEQDPSREKLDWLVEDIFIPWRGAYGIGLPHLIGGLSAAATGSLRALLDSAHINNAPTLLKLKGSRISGQTQNVAVTQIAEIEGPVGIDDIRKYLMPMPFNAPSPVLFQLLGWLTDAAKGVVSTASEKIADATSNTPVGTTQALIEQGAIIFSSIHARLHNSQEKSFEIVIRLLKTYFPGELQQYGLQPQTLSMQNIRPVSDPHIFSEAQRYAQAQGVLQLAASDPELAGKYNKLELHRSILSLMKVTNVDRILPPAPPPPQPADPAGEMIAFMQNKPVVVAPQQDHFSHIAIHMNYLRNPMLGRNPVMVPITSKILDHLREHLGYFYATRLMQSAQQSQMQAQQNAMFMQQQGLMPLQPPPVEEVMAQASGQIVVQDMEAAQEALILIEEIAEFVRQNGPQDPNMAAVKYQTEIQKLDIERQRDKDIMDAELKAQQQAHRVEVDQINHALDAQKIENSKYADILRSETQKEIEQMRQMIEMQNNEASNRQKQLTDLMKNEDDNRTKIIIEQMKAELATFAQSMSEGKETPETARDDSPQMKRIEEMLAQAEKSKQEDRLGIIMQGLQEAIASARSPRVTIPLRNEAGDLIGARSELE